MALSNVADAYRTRIAREVAGASPPVPRYSFRNRGPRESAATAGGAKANPLNRRGPLAAIAESPDDAIMVLTRDNGILTWSPGAERLYGYPAAEVLGRDSSFLEPDDADPATVRSLEGVDCANLPHRRDAIRRRKDGSLVDVEITVVPVENERGEVTRRVEIARDVTERREAEKTLRDLSGRLIRAQEEERSRIARELHDDLSQRLALLAIELEQFAGSLPKAQAGVRARLLGLWSQANEASAEIHKLSHELHPSKLDHLGLTSAVKGYCDELSRRHGIPIELAHGDVPTDIPKHVALCVYRIVQEALRNVVKHSGAGRARVELGASSRELVLTVSDSGIGFEVGSAAAKLGLGLVSMRERLRLVEGELAIGSQPGRGTRIDVRIPLAGAHRGAGGLAPAQPADRVDTAAGLARGAASG